MTKTCFSIFSGCGGSDSGMSAAGYLPIGGVEFHQPAADLYNANHTHPATVANILDIDAIPAVDLLWASPVCKSFSTANRKRGEKEEDIQVAKHIAMLMATARPRHIAIENVRDYAKSESLEIIWTALAAAGYYIDDRVYNAANYGAPTTRERLIIRASLDPLGEVVSTHRNPHLNRHQQLSLFATERLPGWVDWHEAIADRLTELPKSQLTDIQAKAISERLVGLGSKLPDRVLVDTTRSRPGQGSTCVSPDMPAFTITAEMGKRSSSRARILIERVGYYKLPKIYVDRPAPTIRSAPHIDDKGSYRVAYNIVGEKYDCYAADVRCLAAWQGFPPDYRWLDNKGEAGRAIGNAVPPPLAAAIAKSFAS